LYLCLKGLYYNAACFTYNFTLRSVPNTIQHVSFTIIPQGSELQTMHHVSFTTLSLRVRVTNNAAWFIISFVLRASVTHNTVRPIHSSLYLNQQRYLQSVHSKIPAYMASILCNTKTNILQNTTFLNIQKKYHRDTSLL